LVGARVHIYDDEVALPHNITSVAARTITALPPAPTGDPPMTILVFFWSSTCGHSRRMDSLIDHFMRVHRGRLKLAKVELSERPDLARRFSVDTAPTLLLLENLMEVERLSGRHTLPSIKAAIEPHLELEPERLPGDLVVA
jgi:thioredoxin-like negative regulator of GroEL